MLFFKKYYLLSLIPIFLNLIMDTKQNQCCGCCFHVHKATKIVATVYIILLIPGFYNTVIRINQKSESTQTAATFGACFHLLLIATASLLLQVFLDF